MGTVNFSADLSLFTFAEALALGVESGALGDSLETTLALVSAHADLELLDADSIRANAPAIEKILPRLVRWKAINRFEWPENLPLTAVVHRQPTLSVDAGGGIQAASSDAPTSSGGRSVETLVEKIESHLSDPTAYFSYEDLEELLARASHGDGEAEQAVESLSGMVVVCLASDIFDVFGKSQSKEQARALAVKLLALGNCLGIAHVKKRALRGDKIESALLEEALRVNRPRVEAVLQSFQEESAASRIVPTVDDFTMELQNNFYLTFFDDGPRGRHRSDLPAVRRFREQNPELWQRLWELTENFVRETRWKHLPISEWPPLEEYRQLLYQAWKIIASYRDLINVYDSYLVTAMNGPSEI